MVTAHPLNLLMSHRSPFAPIVVDDENDDNVFMYTISEQYKMEKGGQQQKSAML